MAKVFSDGFESGSFSVWDVDNSNPNTYLAVNAGSALVGTRGCEVSGGCFGCAEEIQEDVTATAGFIRFGFRFNRNDFSIASGEQIDELFLFDVDTSAELIFSVIFGNVGGVLRMTARHHNDAAANQDITWDPPAGSHRVELRVQAASSAVANDGEFQLYINTVLQGAITGIDNYNNMTDSTLRDLWIKAEQSASGGTGSVYVDELTLRDDDTAVYSLFTGYDLVAGGGQP